MPIVVGYIVAHYLSFFVSVGLQTLAQIGDPLGRGWTLTNWVTHIDKYAIYEIPTGLAVIKVVAVITGHILGAISAHDRCVRLLPRRHAIVGQLPMLVLMVGLHLHRPLAALLLLTVGRRRRGRRCAVPGSARSASTPAPASSTRKSPTARVSLASGAHSSSVVALHAGDRSTAAGRRAGS